MITCYMIDGQTRIHLPQTRWAMAVLIKLAEMNHQVLDIGPAPEHDSRGPDEKARVSDLLDSTGL